MISQLPFQVKVDRLVQSRYSNNERPDQWENRAEGVDTVIASDGQRVRLLSDGGQSPPQTGWTIILTEGTPNLGYRWTLYSYPKLVKH